MKWNNAQFRLGALATAGLLVSACGAGGTTNQSSGGADCLENNLEMVIPFAPGGTIDPMARKLGDMMAKELGVDIQYTNKEGASGVLGVTSVVTSKTTDGSLLGFAANSTLALAPVINADTHYKSVDDYDALGLVAQAPSVIAVPADSPWNNLEDLLTDAKSHPGEVRVATTGYGSARHATVVALNKDADVELKPAFFSGGTGESIIAVLQGSVEAITTDLAPLVGQIEAGDLKLLGVASDERLKAYPDAQTFKEVGLDFASEVSQSEYFIVIPNGVAETCRKDLEDALKSAVQSKDWAAFALLRNFDVPSADADAEDRLKSENDKFEQLKPLFDQK